MMPYKPLTFLFLLMLFVCTTGSAAELQSESLWDEENHLIEKNHELTEIISEEISDTSENEDVLLVEDEDVSRLEIISEDISDTSKNEGVFLVEDEDISRLEIISEDISDTSENNAYSTDYLIKSPSDTKRMGMFPGDNDSLIIKIIPIDLVDSNIVWKNDGSIYEEIGVTESDYTPTVSDSLYDNSDTVFVFEEDIDNQVNVLDEESNIFTGVSVIETKPSAFGESDERITPLVDSSFIENRPSEQPESMYSPLRALSVSPGYPSIMDIDGNLKEYVQITRIPEQVHDTLITSYSRTHGTPSMLFTEFLAAAIMVLTSGALGALYVLRPELTDPESRPVKILAAVRDHQGVTITELQRLTGYSRNSVSYNIHRLESYHKISKINRGGTYYYYTGTIPANGNEERMLHILSRKNPHIIFHTIMENPGITQKELIETTGIPQTTCQWHLSCLIRDQTISTQKEKNSIYYTALPEYVWLYNYLTKSSSMSSEDRNDDSNSTGADGT